MGVPMCRAVVPVAEKRADHHEAVTAGGADGGVAVAAMGRSARSIYFRIESAFYNTICES